MSLIEHAKRELEISGLMSKDSDYEGMIGEAVLELIEVFSKQGHSGCSAGIVSDIFNKLSRYKTLTPINANEDEWIEYTDGNYQNIRNGAVFKEGKEGRAYYIDAYVKKTKSDGYWNGNLRLKDGRKIGKCYIKDFSKMPTVIIDVEEKEIEKDNWDTWVEDEGQLEELAKYYDFSIS